MRKMAVIPSEETFTAWARNPLLHVDSTELVPTSKESSFLDPRPGSIDILCCELKEIGSLVGCHRFPIDLGMEWASFSLLQRLRTPPDWTGLDWTGLHWTLLDSIGVEWTLLEWMEWSGVDFAGLCWSGWSGVEWTLLDSTGLTHDWTV
jgi:hypothetical protein